ncbi:MAG: GGDEF domain-containing protein [Rhodobacterales bacterium]|nr:GGDEF domain-containing protein [Rhodobacterales bacterium]
MASNDSSPDDLRQQARDLRSAADKINKGLVKVLDMVEAVSRDNQAFITYQGGPDGGGGNSNHAKAMNDALALIRSQVAALTGQAVAFEETMCQCGDVMTEVTEKLHQVTRQAKMDPLTGAANLDRFREALAEALRTAGPGGAAPRLAIMVGDIDNFAAFNDRLGRPVGDQILRLIVQTMQSQAGPGNLVARLEEDTFAVLMHGCDAAAAAPVAEAIRATLSSRQVKNSQTGEPLGQLTISMGLDGARPGDTPERMLARADKAMHLCKQRGGNQVKASA